MIGLFFEVKLSADGGRSRYRLVAMWLSIAVGLDLARSQGLGLGLLLYS